MSVERTKHCYIDDFGYSMFGLGYGWRHVIMYAARKQTIIDVFLHSSDNVYNVFIVEYCDNLYNYNLT